MMQSNLGHLQWQIAYSLELEASVSRLEVVLQSDLWVLIKTKTKKKKKKKKKRKKKKGRKGKKDVRYF